MAETGKKYRAGYYYAVEPKERINESDKYIHGLTFEVVFRIYDRDGKEQFFDEINEDHVPEVFIHAGSGILNVGTKELYMPAAFRDTGIQLMPVMVDKCETPTGYDIVRFYKEQSDNENDTPVPVEIDREEFNKLLCRDEFNHADNMGDNRIEARIRSIAVFGKEVTE